MHIFPKVQKGKQKMDIYKCPILKKAKGILEKMQFETKNEI
jgi:hypothetical protein